MNKLYYISLFFAIVFLSSCEDNDSESVNNDTVVEAYLYEGSSSIDIKLSEIIPFEDMGAEEEKVITGAEAYVYVDDTEYLLKEQDNNPGHYTFSDYYETIHSGQEISFYFNKDKEIRSQTIVPERPQNVQLSVNEMYIEQISSLMDLADLAESTVEISWDNPDNSYYYVSVKNIEENPETIDPNNYIPDVDGLNTPPLQTSFSILWINQLNDYGTYEIVVYKVNSEYVDLYNSQQQDSRTLSEPLTNIDNGYGIFTAIAADTVYLEILKP